MLSLNILFRLGSSFPATHETYFKGPFLGYMIVYLLVISLVTLYEFDQNKDSISVYFDELEYSLNSKWVGILLVADSVEVDISLTIFLAMTLFPPSNQ